jgi:hypothetical protein
MCILVEYDNRVRGDSDRDEWFSIPSDEDDWWKDEPIKSGQLRLCSVIW